MTATERLVLPGRFAAAILDYDGLLVDSEPAWAAAEAELFARHGMPIAAGELPDTHGQSVQATVEMYAERIGTPAADLYAELLTSMLHRYATEVPLRPGVLTLVSGLRGRMRLAVASNSSTDLVLAGLHRHGLDGAFDHVVSAPEVGRSKPAPDVYLEACRRLGVAPAAAIAFEDSTPGVAAAKAAGLVCVGIPERDPVDLSEADIVLASLEDVVIAPG